MVNIPSWDSILPNIHCCGIHGENQTDGGGKLVQYGKHRPTDGTMGEWEHKCHKFTSKREIKVRKIHVLEVIKVSPQWPSVQHPQIANPNPCRSLYHESYVNLVQLPFWWSPCQFRFPLLLWNVELTLNAVRNAIEVGAGLASTTIGSVDPFASCITDHLKHNLIRD